MKNLFIIIVLLFTMSFNIHGQVTVSGAVSGNGDYTTLGEAFTALNSSDQTNSNILVAISGDITETATASLTRAAGWWTRLTIYPTGGGWTISGNIAGSPVIDLNGADYVTIDGRVDQLGDTKSLIISNTSTSSAEGTSTIRFVNDASGNIIRYCTIKGSETVTDVESGAVIILGSASNNGNDGNTITYNDITNAGGNRPLTAIENFDVKNSGNTISYNNIYDFINISIDNSKATGICFNAAGTAFIINNNSFYETYGIGSGSNSAIPYFMYLAGTGHSVFNNQIGGKAPLCGGSPFNKTAGTSIPFYGIYTVGGSSGSIYGNRINNIVWSNWGNAAFYWIRSAGTWDIGSSGGNTIGNYNLNLGVSETIKYNSGSNLGSFYGFYDEGSSTIANNKIMSITVYNSNTSGNTNFYGIYSSSASTITGNSIGSASSSDSIKITSPSTSNPQLCYGIYLTGGFARTVSNNTIMNIKNETTNTTAGSINGIYTDNGADTITGNTIRDLQIANGNTSSDGSVSICGIVVNLAANVAQNISSNTIYNLSNSNGSFVGSVFGIYFNGGTEASSVNGNFIHSLSVNSSSTGATISGIKIDAGVANYSNNVIYLGGNTESTLYGIYESGAAGNDNNLYFNTIYLSGSPTNTLYMSYAIYSAFATNTRDIRNNILVNARSTAGGSNLHYALYIGATGGSLTCNYNDYFVSGIGGTLGYYGGNKSSAQIVDGQDVNSKAINPLFINTGGTAAVDYISATNMIGTPGTGILYDYRGMIRGLSFPLIGAMETEINLIVTASSGATDAVYETIREAFFVINAGTHTGNIDIKINHSTTETASAVLNASDSGSASYLAVNIYPVSSGMTISGNLNTPLIDLNGADNVTIDGRINQSGITKDLTISNTSTYANNFCSTIRFINDACSNVVQYCTIKGSETDHNSGVILFSTTSVTGNSSNAILYNDITNAGGKRPYGAVFMYSATAPANSGITISNNNFYDQITTYSIKCSTNTAACTISNNSFYETTPLAATLPLAYFIGMSGSGHSVFNNYIGGSAPLCSGTFTETDVYSITFYSILTFAGSSGSIYGNTIKNFSFPNTAGGGFRGIYSQGTWDIGSSGGNTIESITTSSRNFEGFYDVGASTIANNIIRSITLTSAGSIFYGIYSTSGSTITGNTIGSTSDVYSINLSNSSPSTAQSCYGMSLSGAATRIISNNTIANMRNATTINNGRQIGRILGINVSGGTNTITGNTIRNLTIGTKLSTEILPAVCGIFLNSTTAGTTQNISGNTIYNLSNFNTASTGYLYGIYYNGGTTASTVSGNFIHSISVSNFTATGGSICGIKINSGVTTYSNNIVSLVVGNKVSYLYGICEYGAAGNNNNLYFNTVYLSGSGPTYSMALYSEVAANTRDFRNNILFNSCGGTSHYALYIASTGGILTCDYNDYFAGADQGGSLGFYGGSKSSTPIVTGQDVHSKSVDPSFSGAGGTTAIDYITTERTIEGITIAEITTDYGNNPRNPTPTMGAYENAVPLPVELTSFTAKANGRTVKLSWETKTEIDNSGFEVQRKDINGTWNKLGFVEGHGTSNSPKYYTFEESKLNAGKLTYRLKQIDNDGTTDYSQEVEIDISLPKEFALSQNYPNPFNPSTVIQFALPIDCKVVIEIFSITGEKVATVLNDEIEAGYREINFNATNLTSGIYLYAIRAGEFKAVKKMLLVK